MIIDNLRSEFKRIDTDGTGKFLYIYYRLSSSFIIILSSQKQQWESIHLYLILHHFTILSFSYFFSLFFSGEIDYEEMREAMIKTNIGDEELRNIFDNIDIDHSGFFWLYIFL